MDIRMIFSVLVGGMIFILMVFVTEGIAKYLGITTYIDFGHTVTIYNSRVDQEIDGARTGLGDFFMILTVSLAVRGGMAVYTKTLNGGVSALGNTILFIILGCFLAYGITNQVIFFIAKFNSFFGKLLDMGCFFGILYFGFKIYKKKRNEIEKDEINE